jgi:dihydrofolate synthase / folylpolyglutamate synthase
LRVTYSETIDYLFTKLPMFSRIGAAAIKKDLHNTLQICGILGNPQTKFKSVHIAGTNGKGSVSHMLAAILQTAGYNTGLYTSPHLYDFRERIKVNGEMVTEDFVIAFTEKMRPHIETIEPSFFEITVAMAFEYFAEKKVDIAIIETGLGGRLDSTNVIHPALSVITNIGWDHMNILGNTIEEIASEKAGIIKKDTPVVIGEKQDETLVVFKAKAHAENAEIYFASERFRVTDFTLENEALEVNVKDVYKDREHLVKPDLPGLYQLKNITTVFQSVEVLKEKGWKISDADLQFGLSHTKSITGLHGRWEKIGGKPSIILEAAHNVNGVREMMKHLENLHIGKLHFILGTVKDKDLSPMLELFPKDADYYYTQASIPRALNASILQTRAEEYGLNGEVYPDVNAALQKAKALADVNDLIIVCGSIFLLAEVDRQRRY